MSFFSLFKNVKAVRHFTGSLRPLVFRDEMERTDIRLIRGGGAVAIFGLSLSFLVVWV